MHTAYCLPILLQDLHGEGGNLSVLLLERGVHVGGGLLHAHDQELLTVAHDGGVGTAGAAEVGVLKCEQK
jgi:hypothetical protein